MARKGQIRAPEGTSYRSFDSGSSLQIAELSQNGQTISTVRPRRAAKSNEIGKSHTRQRNDGAVTSG
jgi:hypothetical protein